MTATQSLTRFLALAALLSLPGQLVCAGLRPHPRVEVDAALLKQVRSLREANDPAWTRFESWLRKRPQGSQTTNYVLPCTFSYLVTGEREDFDCGWQAVRSRVYRNGLDRGGGLLPLLDLYKGNVIVTGRRSPTSLYREDYASFGQMDIYNQQDAEGFIHLFGLPNKVEALLAIDGGDVSHYRQPDYGKFKRD